MLRAARETNLFNLSSEKLGRRLFVVESREDKSNFWTQIYTRDSKYFETVAKENISEVSNLTRILVQISFGNIG
jgi:hypothetical protein